MTTPTVSAQEALRANSSLKSINFIPSRSTDIHDYHLFPLVPPPSTQPKIERSVVYTNSTLCDECQTSLEYYAYVLEDNRSSRTDSEESHNVFSFVHHHNLVSVLQAAEANCHLCVFLARFLRAPVDPQDHTVLESFLSETQVEMSWESEFYGEDDQRRGRLHFALTNPDLKRTSENYLPCLRLDVWPTTDSHLFTRPVQLSRMIGSEENRLAEEGDELSLSREGSSDQVHQDSPSEDSRPPILTNSSETPESDEGDNDCTISAASKALAKQWLAHCQNNEDGRHSECNRFEGNWLPTRLIDVQSTWRDHMVRIVSSAESPDSFINDRKYVTLSHCWGLWGATELPVLDTANERERLDQGVSLDALPATFQDALTVAGWFEVRWLWIDSLCIIQDSDLDWQREALQMHQVYKQALVNISADAASDARGGLLQMRNETVVQPLKLHLTNLGETLHATIEEGKMFEWMNQEPLSRRAWVFQERHLARRVLHFTKCELFWECCAKGPYFASETFPNGAPLRTIFDGKPKIQSEGILHRLGNSNEKLLDLWDDLCQMYSKHQLSKRTDKLVALVGLVKEFEELLPNERYIAGMWRCTLPQSLLWQVNAKGGGRRIPAEGQIAPSWSWASIDGACHKHSPYKRHETKLLCTIIDVQGHSPHHEVFLSNPKAPLIISGFVRRIRMEDNHRTNTVFPVAINHKTKLHVYDQELLVFKSFFFFHYTLDIAIPLNIIDAYFLFITVRQDPERVESDLDGLLLRKVEEPDVFERIGTLSAALTHHLSYITKEHISDRGEVWEALKESMDAKRKLENQAYRERGFKDETPAFSPVDNKNGSYDDADITQVLYAHCEEVDDDRFEQLAPQTIKLI